ncbi:MAG: hypothetical protein V3U92_19580 [Cellulophaga sp.]
MVQEKSQRTIIFGTIIIVLLLVGYVLGLDYYKEETGTDLVAYTLSPFMGTPDVCYDAKDSLILSQSLVYEIEIKNATPTFGECQVVLEAISKSMTCVTLIQDRMAPYQAQQVKETLLNMTALLREWCYGI